MGLLAEDVLDLLLHHGHAGHAADEDDLVDIGGGQAGVLERGAAGADGALDEIFHQTLQLGAAQLEVEVFRAGGVGGDEGQVDVGLLGGGELHLGLLRLFLETLQGHLVLAQVDALLALELVGQPVDDAHVEVFAAEEGVAIGRLDLEDAVADLEDGDVEGAAAEVIDGDLLLALLVEAVGQRGGGGLVDDAQHVEAGDLAGVLGGLTLRVVEVGGDGDHRVGDLFAQVLFGSLLHLGEHHGRDLRWPVALAVDIDGDAPAGPLDDLEGADVYGSLDFRVGKLAPDQPLDGVEGARRVGDRLPFGNLTHQALVAVGKGNHRRGGAVAFGIGDDLGVAAFHDRHARVGGAQINSNYLTHLLSPSAFSSDMLSVQHYSFIWWQRARGAATSCKIVIFSGLSSSVAHLPGLAAAAPEETTTLAARSSLSL